MFLLNHTNEICVYAYERFTIQNVSIKLEFEEAGIEIKWIFTIQNVSIKYLYILYLLI